MKFSTTISQNISYFSQKSKSNDNEAKENSGSSEEMACIPSGKKREQWSNSTEFLMSCIAMSVGLGNVWRFPFTAYENGGGAFLIPYLIVLLLVGRPLYLLEVGLGQFCSGGPVKVWRLSPAFSGIGYGQLLASASVMSYYCSLIGLSIYYLVASCQTTLPWTLCHEHLQEDGRICVPSNSSLSDFSGLNNTVTSSEQYFKRQVLKAAPDLSEGIGLPDPALAGCLLATWIFIFISLAKGVQSSGKLAYFNALFPYAVMFVLLVKGLTLEGALDGLKFFFTPDWSKLMEPKVWYAAVTQSFFSLSVGFGALTTYSSYNKFRHNSYKDALIISVADTGTSILAGTIIFAILGHLSHQLDKPIETVVNSGAGLAFVSYPEVISKFEAVPQLFAVLFFLMLITLGFGSATGLISNIITAVCDAFPSFPRAAVTAVISTLGFLTGLLYVTPGGQALLELVDYYGGSLLILTLALAEIVAIAWVYNVNNVLADLSMMLNRRLGLYWKLCWSLIIPACLTFILFFFLYDYKPVKYNQTEMPQSYQLGGWLIAITGVAFLPFLMSLELWRNKKDVKKAFQPSTKWGPQKTEDWRDWKNSKNQAGGHKDDKIVELVVYDALKSNQSEDIVL